VNNLRKRIITGLVFIVLILGCIFADHKIFLFLFLFITILGLWEFYTLSESGTIFPNKIAGTIAGVFIFVSNALITLNIASFKLLLFSFLPVFVILLLELYRKKPKPFANISYTLTGLIYIAVPFSLLSYFPDPNLSGEGYNIQFLLGFFLIVWINETSAYLVGSVFGKKKLFKRVSPNKTWEGMIGGAVLALLATIAISVIFRDITMVNWFVIALIIIVFGTYGDLFESLIKRSNNTKDSGKILPGHGGILDRFDGVLISAPFVFIYLLFIT